MVIWEVAGRRELIEVPTKNSAYTLRAEFPQTSVSQVSSFGEVHGVLPIYSLSPLRWKLWVRDNYPCLSLMPWFRTEHRAVVNCLVCFSWSGTSLCEYGRVTSKGIPILAYCTWGKASPEWEPVQLTMAWRRDWTQNAAKIAALQIQSCSSFSL